MTANEKMKTHCTCTDYACPCHPVNHDQGCTLCILKNQAQGEVPSCLFKQVDPEYHGPNWFFSDFAHLVVSKEKPE